MSESSYKLEPKTSKKIHRANWQLDIYAPWWGTQRKGTKWEIGFRIAIRDPRKPCDHHHRALWNHNNGHRPYCTACGAELPVQGHKEVRNKPARWRWVKIYVASTKTSRKHKHKIFMVEAQTNLSEGVNGKMVRRTGKTFIRLKAGRGGPLT